VSDRQGFAPRASSRERRAEADLCVHVRRMIPFSTARNLRSASCHSAQAQFESRRPTAEPPHPAGCSGRSARIWRALRAGPPVSRELLGTVSVERGGLESPRPTRRAAIMAISASRCWEGRELASAVALTIVRVCLTRFGDRAGALGETSAPALPGERPLARGRSGRASRRGPG
jgi:hypothetical protein